MVASDRISTYDVVHPTPIPRQGQGAHRAVGVLVRADRADRPEPPRLLHRRARGGRAAARCSSRSSRWSRSSASCAATSPARAGRTTRRTGAVCGIELPGGPERVRAAAGADLHPGDEGRRRRPRRERRLRPRRRDRRRPRAARGAAPALDRALLARRPSTRASAGSSSPTPSSSSAADADGTIVLGDEVLTPGLLALLAGRRLRAGPRPADRSTSSTCATGRPARAGTRRRPRRALPDDVVEGTARALPRGLRADHRRAVRRLAATQRRGAMTRARVLIRPKEGILDPRARPSSGRCRRSASTASSNVRVGRLVELEVEDPSRVPTRCASSCSPTR